RLDTGFLGTPIILDTLCKIGRTDMAYEMLFQTEAPSWLYEVENGATTIWESWHTKNPDGSPMAVSLNHYAFGCVDDWIFRNIVGIVPTSPGFKTFKIAPVIDERIIFAKRTYETEYGKISVEWRKENEEFLMDVIVPCNTTATIVLPDGECHECGSGFYHFSRCL
ncbi:MAG: alpha-L-rhamnosidase, partial [Lachnospiraceae bacterium]|nr:alpha-L-rhamnosidase [Lachnospiraceae bacterium]